MTVPDPESSPESEDGEVDPFAELGVEATASAGSVSDGLEAFMEEGDEEEETTEPASVEIDSEEVTKGHPCVRLATCWVGFKKCPIVTTKKFAKGMKVVCWIYIGTGLKLLLCNRIVCCPCDCCCICC